MHPEPARHAVLRLRSSLEARRRKAAVRARSIVARGLAFGVLPASDARAPGPAVCVVPFSDGTLEHRTAVAVRRDRRPTPAADALLALVDEVAANAVQG